MIQLKNPITMRGTIRKCWLLNFRTPLSEAQKLVPSPLELVAHGGFAFWGIVVCEIAGMRPWFAPGMLGLNYRHAAYRFHVRAPLANGREAEGLYFIRSDCNSALLTATGNILTDFNFNTASIDILEDSNKTTITVHSPEAPARIVISKTKPPELADGSVFASLDESARFLKYKPAGISMHGNDRLNIVQITRNELEWKYRLRHVEQADFGFFKGRNVSLEICYEVEPISYQWNRGKIIKAGKTS